MRIINLDLANLKTETGINLDFKKQGIIIRNTIAIYQEKTSKKGTAGRLK